jgi:hypothetical protein
LASASVVAPFDYVAMLWAFLFGYPSFGEIRPRTLFVGSAIIAGGLGSAVPTGQAEKGRDRSMIYYLYRALATVCCRSATTSGNPRRIGSPGQGFAV